MEFTMKSILAKLFALMFLVGFSFKLYGAPVANKAIPVEHKSHKTKQVQNHDNHDVCDDGCVDGCCDCDHGSEGHAKK